MGREFENDLSQVEKSKKVMVVGAGPAGLMAAKTAAQRGHQVTVFEKEPYVGGAFRAAAYPMGKAELSTVPASLMASVKALGVDVKLGTEVNEALIQSEKPDAVIVATGSRPLIPPIEGIDSANVVTAEDVLYGNVDINPFAPVVVCGGGEVGGETAEFIAESAFNVTILEMQPAILNDMVIQNKAIQYQTYDVTALIQEGDNELIFQLADGWYRGSCGAWGLKNQYGTETKLLAQLELTGVDGSITTICTDGSWKWSNDGPIRFADNKDGEIVDANRVSSYSGTAKVTACNVVPTASNNVSVTEHETFTPALITTPSGKKVLDFGQNIAGYCAFAVDAKEGQKIFLRFGEMLDGEGEFTQANIQCRNKKITTPLQRVEYTCKEGRNEYKTRFAIFGFQYVLVETDVDFAPEDFTAIAVYSDLGVTARFDSSNPLLNKFVENTLWSAKNNSADVPTDCPTRERHGWTGDSQLFAVTADYLMNYIPFAKKHIRDLTDWQREDGAFPQIAPYGGVDSYMNAMNGSVGWADAGVLIPYRYWKLFGDIDFIRDNYAAMAKYARFMMKRCGKRGLMAKSLGLKGPYKRYAVNAGQSYGEWAEPADVYPNRWTDMIAPHPEVSTAYTAYVMGVMEEIAGALGKTEDVSLYRGYRKGCTAAYQELVETKAYSLDTDRQARLVRPLYFNLLNEKQTGFAKKRLIEALEHYGWRAGTGFLSTPLILYVLADIDLEAAYRLLENEEMPGWLFMPKAGASTIWESWEGTRAHGGIASLDHYSKGACCEWVFRVMCGVQVAGENRFTIAPRPGGKFTSASLSYDSVYGTVSCSWLREYDKITYTVTVPANTTAELSLPGGLTQELTAGTYTLSKGI